jgi:hypothetical protein
MAPERNVQFSAPTWLRNLGFSSWLLVGFVLIIVGVMWLLGETSTIVMPVILATVLGAVAGPAVAWLARHRVPRAGGAILVLLGLVAIGVVIALLVFGGVSAQSGDISAKANKALPEIKTTLLSGVATGIGGLKNLVFFLAFAILSTLFVLKDGPVMHRFVNRHMGVPEPVANTVTTNIAKSLRSYFLAVTIIAAFNAILIGGAALILGVPDPGGRCPAGQRHPPADDPAARDGRDAEPQPPRGARRHDRRRRAVRDDRADARRPADVGRGAHRQRAAGPGPGPRGGRGAAGAGAGASAGRLIRRRERLRAVAVALGSSVSSA